MLRWTLYDLGLIILLWIDYEVSCELICTQNHCIFELTSTIFLFYLLHTTMYWPMKYYIYTSAWKVPSGYENRQRRFRRQGVHPEKFQWLKWVHDVCKKWFCQGVVSFLYNFSNYDYKLNQVCMSSTHYHNDNIIILYPTDGANAEALLQVLI